ncbi:LysR substrate-binding domain-containing protein [Vibrio sp. SS-MA-C1-2]|uniref:LysR substrate-binding domain-containing protein n=1 Tax=Vibrio sp. SS-MA-C1-2 TaxID=2908646 RepID=UPI001F413869|nr:LysR substrate-binding domain-containing protein [Vibrio sp. SS-MA-C1-2]UJF17043.1 LysR substrate-binding domain-containing protein [Vibrio sp. SS-MA-C1-2]
MSIARSLAINGMGIALLPHHLAVNYESTGELVKLFSGEWFKSGNMLILYKQNSQLPERFKIFIQEFKQFYQRYVHNPRRIED